MKTIYLRSISILICYVFLSLSVQAQAWEWGQQFSGNGNIKPVDIAVDANDNIYIVGTYDTDDMTVGTDILINLGNSDVFVSSFSSTGAYRWSVQINGTGINDVKALNIDENGDLYVIGGFRGAAVHFSATDSLENYDYYDSYLAKYNSNGVLQYARRVFWGTNQERIQDVIVDMESNLIVVAGVFKEELIYFDGTINQTITAIGPKDQLIATFNYAGEIQDIVTYNTTTVNTTLKNISLCNAGGYFVGGDLRGRINFSGTEYLEGDTVNTDVMVFRVDNNLDYLWGRLGRGAGYDHVNSMASDKYSNVYITGKTESNPTTFDSTATLFGNPIVGYGASDIYLTKYNRDGVLQWARRKGDAGDDDAYGLAVSNNTVQFAGNYAGQIIINQDTLDSGSLTNVNTGFAKYDFEGNEVGAQEITGNLEDRGKGVIFDSNEETYVMGYFASTTVHAGPNSFANTNSPVYDGFLFKYEYPFTVVFSTIKYPTCNGDSDGELVATPYFGVTPYSYSWSHDSGLADSSATELSSGNYSVSVTDGNNQTVFISISILETAAITIIESISKVSCNNGNDGAINITVSGGIGLKTYLWSSGNGSGLNPSFKDQSSLTAGTYDVLVTDENGCTASASYVVFEPEPISFNGSLVTDIVFPEGENGAISLNISGGTPDYFYSWTGPDGYLSNEKDIDSLEIEGNYSISILDANACEADTVFTLLSNGDNLMAFINIKKDVSCIGGSDGEATVTVIGEQGTLHYVWENSESQKIGGDCPTVTGLIAGNYMVTVYDYRKCHVYAEVTINEPDSPLEGSIVGQDVICFNEQNGIADLTTQGGTPPYSFEWSTGATSEDINGLAAGTYTVIITDANACTFQTDVTISEPEPIQNVLVLDNGLLCYGDLSAVASVHVSGGIEPYSYLWNDPGSQNTSTATNLGAGLYSVTVTDANACIETGTIDIEEPPQIVISFNHVDVSCFGGNDGAIDAIVQGGTPPYNYYWSNGGMGSSMNNIEAGIYSLEITDLNQCQMMGSIEILQPSEIIITGSTVADVSCFDQQDGEINIVATGGVEPLIYKLAPGDMVNETGIFSGLAPGNYMIEVSDANNCGPVILENLVINEPSPLAGTIVGQDVRCFNEQNGIADLTTQGGTPPYSFEWSTGATSEDINGLAAGTYTVIITDANACTFQTDVTISEPEPIQNVLVLDNGLLCYGDLSAVASVHVSGGIEPYSYLWNDPGSQNTSTATNLGAGLYSVTVTDANACIETGTIDIEEPPQIVISFNHVDVSCFGGNDGAIDAIVQGGTPPYNYYWSNGGMGSSMNNIEAGIYSLEITDLNQCQMMGSIEILQPSEIIITGSTVADVSCFDQQDGEINIAATGGVEPLIYKLTPGDMVNETGIFSGLTSGNYLIEVSDVNNCGPVITENLVLIEPEIITIDSIKFTDESADGTNDGFINIFASGGTAPLYYILNPGAIQNQTGEFTGLQSGTYNIDISDTNSCGPVNTGDIFIGNLNIKDLELTMFATIYPNPTQGHLHIVIKGKTNKAVQLEIINMNGKMIYQEEIITNYKDAVVKEIDISDQPKGIYLLKISGEKAFQSVKIVLK